MYLLLSLSLALAQDTPDAAPPDSAAPDSEAPDAEAPAEEEGRTPPPRRTDDEARDRAQRDGGRAAPESTPEGDSGRSETPKAPAPYDEDTVFLFNARVWDGTGSATHRASISIRDGVIEEVGPDLLVPSGVRVIDASDYTITPGLIDSHVHLTSVPGSALRGDDLDTMVAAVRQQLRAYLACGVTTVLDTGINHEHARMIRGWLEGDQPGPHPEFLGVPVSPPGGYITTVFPEAPSHGTPEAVTAHLDSLVALDAAGVKVTMEQGFIGKGWPLQTPEMRETISREAAARDLPIYIHGMSPREYRYSLDMGVYAMVHPLEWPHRGTINRLREEGTYVISTIGIADMFMVANDPARLSDPTTRLVTPEYILDTAADPAMRDAAREQVLEMIAPDLPGFLEGVAYQQLDGLGPTRRRVRALQESVVQLQRAGVKVIVGSDAGNWTVMPWSFHGISTLREIELWGEAGIDPEDTLLAATRLPAEMLGLDDEIGTIEPGKRGDLVLYRGDPTRDLRDVRTVAYTVRAGVAKTPTQWMEQ